MLYGFHATPLTTIYWNLNFPRFFSTSVLVGVSMNGAGHVEESAVELAILSCPFTQTLTVRQADLR